MSYIPSLGSHWPHFHQPSLLSFPGSHRSTKSPFCRETFGYRMSTFGTKWGWNRLHISHHIQLPFLRNSLEKAGMEHDEIGLLFLSLASTTYFIRSLLYSRFCYRKPIFGSPAADRPTSWENIRREHRAQEEDLNRTKEGRIVEDEYRSAVMFYQSWRRVTSPLNQIRERFYHLQKIGLASFMKMTLMDFMELDQSQEDAMLDKDLCAITLEHCGFKRCSRKCNECHVPLAH